MTHPHVETGGLYDKAVLICSEDQAAQPDDRWPEPLRRALKRRSILIEPSDLARDDRSTLSRTVAVARAPRL